jgi:hypothetical protein
MSFVMYNVEEDDIYNQYALGNTTNTNQPNNCVFNLITIEGVNELQLLNREEGNILIGYTAASNVQYSDQAQFFVISNDIPADDEIPPSFTNPNILRLPGNAIINSIEVINVKGGPIFPDTNSEAIIFTCKNDFVDFINIIGSIDPTEGVSLSEFNNTVLGSEITVPLDETNVFLYIPNSLRPPYNQYQLQITINYTLV